MQHKFSNTQIAQNIPTKVLNRSRDGDFILTMEGEVGIGMGISTEARMGTR